MAVSKDSKADPNGKTLVRIVNENGTSLQDLATAHWSVHPSPAGSTCPVWINTVVISAKPEGAVLGKNLAAQDTAGQSSCSQSEKVLAIFVDDNGNLKELKNFPFALVRSVKKDANGAEIKIDDMAVAGEIWLTDTPIQTIIDNTAKAEDKADIIKMAGRCKP